jgi:glucuronokinase
VHAATVPARTGLAGNPSDAYGGAALAVPVPSLTATVEVVDAPAVRVVGAGDEGSWADVGALVAHVDRYGHEGGQRLVTAALATLARHTGTTDDACELRWSTNIPRSVGLGGSSALVIATIQALAQRWAVTLEPLALARLALAAEVSDLGIAAGLMDRAVQALGAPALVDGDDARPVAALGLPTYVVAWQLRAAGPSQRVHGALRRRFEQGEADVLAAMTRLATLGRDAAAALESGDAVVLEACVRATWRERQALGIVGTDVVAMVGAFDELGVAATSAGSGGAVVGVLPPTVAPADAVAAISRLADGAVAVLP